MKSKEYDAFIASKQAQVKASGFEVDEKKLNKNLFPFQRYCVRKALLEGRYAIFAGCGTGKTLILLDWAHQVTEEIGEPVIIISPLAVSIQTIKEGEKFGIHVEKLVSDVFGKGIYITNYEQLDNVKADQFCGLVCDESGIIKNYTGKTKKALIEKFGQTKYKLACTATPAPNDSIELGSHCELLNVLSGQEMLATFFVNDVLGKGDNKTKWRLKKHAVKDFYRWVSQWSIMFSNPSEIGFEGESYVLPKLTIDAHELETEKKDNGLLFNDSAVSATDFNAELRRTATERLDKAIEIAKTIKVQVIIWIKHNSEGDYLTERLDDCIEVAGSDNPDEKEKMLFDFAHGKYRILVTKVKIAGWGLNYQNCQHQIFASIDFSFEGLYQAIRRSYRFGQKKEVHVHIISTDTMGNVVETIRRKQKEFDTMQSEMVAVVNENKKELKMKSKNVTYDKVEGFDLRLGDSFDLIKDLKDESIDSSIFSPPFSSLYTYSDNARDLSNCTNEDEFFKHFEFMIDDLFRVLKPGRMLGMHLMQLTTGISRDGYFSIKDFRGDIIRLFQSHGFIFHAEVTIWKDPELCAVRTKNHQLLHKTTKRDCAIVRPGLADYLVVMRKPGVNAEPINWNGKGIPFQLWCKIASPVWLDIDASDTLKFYSAKEEKDEKHLTPTQLSVIERFLLLYSNKNDVVFSPFMGCGSEMYMACKMKRRGVGYELKESYFNACVRNLNSALKLQAQYEFDIPQDE